MFGSISCGDNSLKYYCKDSNTQHKQAASPKCDLDEKSQILMCLMYRINEEQIICFVS